jgi:hypothetical protein
MKLLFCVLLFLTTLLLHSQTSDQKLSKDSVKYYQAELSKLYKANYDSLKNSEEYKFLTTKLKSKSEENFGVELIFILGYQHNDYTNLNERLVSLNLNEIKPSMSQIGVGLAFRFNKVITGYDMNVLLGDRASGGYLHIYASTNLLKTKRFIFSPQIGYGRQSVTYKYKVQSPATDFNSYFTAPNKVEIYHSNSVVDFALAFKLYPKTDNYNYLSLFRIGYRYGLKEKPWKINDGNSSGAPYDRNSNFYLQLIIGFGN